MRRKKSVIIRTYPDSRKKAHALKRLKGFRYIEDYLDDVIDRDLRTSLNQGFEKKKEKRDEKRYILGF